MCGICGIYQPDGRIVERSTLKAMADTIRHRGPDDEGTHVEPEELDMLLEKLRYLSSGAEFVVLAGSLPRGVDPGFYSELIRELSRRQVPTVLDSEAEPLRVVVCCVAAGFAVCAAVCTVRPQANAIRTMKCITRPTPK